MAGQSLYQVGGLSLVGGGVAFGVGALLHAQQPATLAEFGALHTGWWTVSHLTLTVALVLLSVGLVTLGLHLHASGATGWGVFGATAAVLGGAGGLAIVAPEAFAFPALLAATDAAAAEQAFFTISAYALGIFPAFFTIQWLAVAVLLYGTLADTSWPRWLSYGGIVAALAVIVSAFATTNLLVGQVMVVLGAATVVATGLTLYPAPVARTAAPAGPATPRMPQPQP